MSDALHILQHALGLDEYGQGTWYRNHFVSGPECDNYATLQALVADGLMVEHPPRQLFGGHSCFVVTEAGKQAVRDQSPKPPRLSRAARRYRRFMSNGVCTSRGEWPQRFPDLNKVWRCPNDQREARD